MSNNTNKMGVAETVMSYRLMEQHAPRSSMIREVRWQYADMAKGGDGGPLGFYPEDFTEECGEEGPSCREYNYPEYQDEFFQEVCDLLQWEW